jgi:hypothetical protein
MARKWIEKRRRGFFGWIFLTAFWLWNAFMAFTIYLTATNQIDQYGKLTSDAERIGYTAGANIGITLAVIIWGVGAVILGMFAHFTRGRREMIEVES